MSSRIPQERLSEQCTWRCRFANPAEVAKLGGTLTASPEVKQGIYLNGTTQYASFPVTHDWLGPNKLTIKLVFTPDFDYDEDAIRTIIHSTNNYRYYVIIQNNANNNTMDIRLGDALIQQIPSATYSPYWNVGEKNTLVIAGESGDTDAWLNGDQIMTSDASSWSPTVPTTLYVGTHYTVGTFLFDGIIHEVSFYRGKWTQEDIDADLGNALHNFEQKSSLWLNMDECWTSGSGKKTRDSSVHGNNVNLGDGAGTGEPDFENPGFRLNGSTDYLKVTSASGVYNTSGTTIVVCFRPDFAWDEDAIRTLYHSTVNYRYLLTKQNSASSYTLDVWMGDTAVQSIASSNYKDYWIPHQKNVAIVSGTSGDTSIWLNGTVIWGNDATVWTPQDPTEIYLGCHYSATQHWFDGVLYHFSVFPFVLSPIQARQITNQLLERYR